MKLLLTDSGVSNASILAALVDLLGRPIAEARALCIPTAGYGGPYGDPDGPWDFITGQADGPMTGLGWKSVGVLELTALPSIDKERWVSWVREADVLLVNGGNTLYLCHWIQESGLADLFPELRDTVYVGLSAGSLVLTPRIGELFASSNPRADGDDSTLGLVDFSIFPHLDSPDRTMAASGAVGRRHQGPGVRHRLPDRHQGDRRQRRGHFRGVLETVQRGGLTHDRYKVSLVSPLSLFPCPRVLSFGARAASSSTVSFT